MTRGHWLELRVPPPVVALLCGLLMWAVARALPSWRIQIPAANWLAAGFVAIGLALAGAAILAFRRARTTSNPMKPQDASTLVPRGIYAWTRNPMYLSWLPIALGWAIFLRHPLALIVVPLFVLYITRFQIVPEERTLAAKFGQEYDAYRKRVRRWG